MQEEKKWRKSREEEKMEEEQTRESGRRGDRSLGGGRGLDVSWEMNWRNDGDRQIDGRQGMVGKVRG